MGNSFDTVKKVLEHQSPNRLPRGELRLGTDLLRKANLGDNLEGHLALVRRLGQDILSFPISDDISMDKSFGYRYFNFKEFEEASKMDDLVKEILGDIVCFRGNVPSSLLYAGTPQQVTDYVKELIDVVGKGGGLRVDRGIWFDEVKTRM